MTNLENVNDPHVIGRGFVAHAVQAGIVTTINSLIGSGGVSKKRLLIDVKKALQSSNLELARALSLDSLELILDYMARVGVPSVVDAAGSPTLIDEEGPAGTWASAGANNSINVTFSEPTAGQLSGAFTPPYTYEIYANGVFMKSGSNVASGGTIDDNFTLVGGRTIFVRVAFVNAQNEMSRLGPTQTVSR